MYRTVVLSGRVFIAMAAIFFASIFVVGNASAQLVGGADDDPVEYDVKVSSGASGQAGEFPLQYTVEYDNGSQEDMVFDGEGTNQRVAAAGISPVAIWWWGIRIPVGHDVACTGPDASGGCWCLCLKWVDIKWWFRWQVRPIYIWYYDPCCR